MPTKYGVIDSRDLTRTVAEITERNLAQAIRQYLDYYNNAFNDFLGRYAFRTTLYQERFWVGTEAGRLRPSDEYSRGVFSRPPVQTYYDIAYPIGQWDDRLGWTELYLAKATGDTINRAVIASQERDRNTMFAELLSSIFYKTNWTYQDPEWGALTVRRLLNGDGQVPPAMNGQTFDGTHTHYLGTNGAVTLAFLRDTVYDHLWEHGHGNDVILEAARDVAATISALTGFIPAERDQDQRINYGSADTPSTATVTDSRAIGRIANMEVVINDDFPDGYGFATDRASEPPIAMREDPEPVLRGYRTMNDTPSDMFPLRGTYFQRRAGFGVRNRSNGVMFSVNGSTAYTDPASI